MRQPDKLSSHRIWKASRCSGAIFSLLEKVFKPINVFIFDSLSNPRSCHSNSTKMFSYLVFVSWRLPPSSSGSLLLPLAKKLKNPTIRIKRVPLMVSGVFFNGSFLPLILISHFLYRQLFRLSSHFQHQTSTSPPQI